MLGKLRHKIGHKIGRTVSRLKGQGPSDAVILMYHRIAEVDTDPWSLCVTPQHFAEHLAVLRDYGTPLRLQDLNQQLGEGQRLRRSIVLTFDDGYADNFHQAKPLLEQYDIPATVFITTGGIDQTQEFWWDELDRLLLQPGRLPDVLRLTIDGEPCEWGLGEAAHYRQADFLRHHLWRMEAEDEAAADPTPRHGLYRSLYQKLQHLSLAERGQLLDDIRVWANAEPVGRPTHRSLSQEELVELGSGELVEIGAHTVSHPFLADLSIVSQQDEIQQSKDYLERTLGRPVTSFSYPNGSYAADTKAAVQAMGFDCACCSIADRVQPDSDRFLLPRVVVEDWDGETFTEWLSGLLAL
ncbi:MAG: polysaccharide deacetylase family protein [Cyanobacteria bacterium P01_F01_bin.4]